MKARTAWLLLTAVLVLGSLGLAQKGGGRVVMAQAQEPDSLDPAFAQGGAVSYNIMRLVGGTLVLIHPDTGEYVPYLAESWDVSADGKTWNFKLKKGVKFHDGTSMTAHDWVYTINRALDPATKARASRNQWAPVQKATAVDDFTLRLELRRPITGFLFNLFTPFTSPVNKEAVEKYGSAYGRNYMGAGPYRIKEFTPGRRLVLSRNVGFNWGPAFANKGPFVNEIEIRFVSDVNAQIAGMRSGELDAINLEGRDAAPFKTDPRFQVLEANLAGLSPYLAVNAKRAPFSDVRVRQALYLGIDRTAMLRIVGLGLGKTQCGPLSSNILGYWAGAEEQCAYNPDKAKALLQQAGFTETRPLRLTLLTSNAPDDVRAAQYLQQAYKTIGVEVRLQQLEAGAQQTAVFAGDYDLSIFALGFGELELVKPFFTSNSISQTNPGFWEDPELDKLLDQTSSTTGAQRLKFIEDVQRRMIEQAYLIPLYNSVSSHVLSAKIKGAKLLQKGANPQVNLFWFGAWVQ